MSQSSSKTPYAPHLSAREPGKADRIILQLLKGAGRQGLALLDPFYNRHTAESGHNPRVEEFITTMDHLPQPPNWLVKNRDVGLI
jgi:hypothetical protein